MRSFCTVSQIVIDTELDEHLEQKGDSHPYYEVTCPQGHINYVTPSVIVQAPPDHSGEVCCSACNTWFAPSRFKPVSLTHFIMESLNRGLTQYAAPRWTQSEEEFIKQIYIQQRDSAVPHNRIYEFLAEKLERSYYAIKQKIENLYKTDKDLEKYKYQSWENREKVIDMLAESYRQGEPLNRLGLEQTLQYQITNHSKPKCDTRGFECWFESFEDAIAEAILQIGFARDAHGALTEERIGDIQQAKEYYHKREKLSHHWTKSEIIGLFQVAHEAGLPLTYTFFARHQDVYQPLIGINRSLEGLRNAVNRMGLTWGDLVIAAVPEYRRWYDEDGNPTRSMGETRVQRFLEQHEIPFVVPQRHHKIPVVSSELQEKGYKNFVPDFIILDDSKRPVAIVEVFGAIADSAAQDGSVSQAYQEKIDAKRITFQQSSFDFIEIHDNETFGSDLSNEILEQKLFRYIPQVPLMPAEPEEEEDIYLAQAASLLRMAG